MWRTAHKIKKRRRNLRTHGFLIIASLLSITILSQALADEDKKVKVEKCYQNGIIAYQEENWSLARKHFHDGYKLIPHSGLSYLISCCSYKLKDGWSTRTFAEQALHDKPSLTEDEADFARFLLTYVPPPPRPGGYRAEGKADGDSEESRYMPKIRSRGPLLINLTGNWRCNLKRNYVIHQTGRAIWWHGKGPDDDQYCANVFYGEIVGDVIEGEWKNVFKNPWANANKGSSGDVVCKLASTDRFTRLVETGGFRPSYWTRRSGPIASGRPNDPSSYAKMAGFYGFVSVEFLAKELPVFRSLEDEQLDSKNPWYHFNWALHKEPQVVKDELIEKFELMVTIKEEEGKDELADWYARICTDWANYGVDFGSPAANSRDLNLHKKWATNMKSSILQEQITMRINKIFAKYIGYSFIKTKYVTMPVADK